MTIRTVQIGSHTHAQGKLMGVHQNKTKVEVSTGVYTYKGELIPSVRQATPEPPEMTPVIERGDHDV